MHARSLARRSIISAKLTTSGLIVKRIQKFSDMHGPLCVESAYPVAMAFVQRDPGKPIKILEAEISDCIAMMMNGTVQAVFTDQPVLSWMVTNYALTGAYVSPILGPNPFSFVYPSGSLLRPFVNPSVIAAQTDPEWIPNAQAITARYFATGADPTATAAVSKINKKTAYAAAGFAAIAFAVAFINGDIGPGCLSRLPARARTALAAPPMPDEECGEQPSLGAVMSELREVKKLLVEMNGGGGGPLGNLARGMKLPAWALGEQNGGSDDTGKLGKLSGVGKLGKPSGGGVPRVSPAAAPSTAQMNAPCGFWGLGGGQAPAEPPRPPSRKSKKKDRA